MELGKENDK